MKTAVNRGFREGKKNKREKTTDCFTVAGLEKIEYNRRNIFFKTITVVEG